MLAFLGAGETHKPPPDVAAPKYQKTVELGINYLKKICPLAGASAGRFGTAPNSMMYSQGIATLALCEAYGMTKDPALRAYAQAAVNYVQKAQAPNGSWGYSPNTNGDTSITGWQVRAIQSARAAKLVVDDRVVKKAVAFLDLAGGGTKKVVYGYTDRTSTAPGTA